ncbi:MAG TPA: twin-arginine translocation signal domain-containing protein [Chloroflexota bacterium]|nr:twin-arginine translocation signal domain-containing protein [Chloroflexota bacterium]
MTRPISRRKFLKLSAGSTGAAAMVELAGLGFDAALVRAQIGTGLTKQGKEIPTVCPYCAVGCGQIATVADGKLIDRQGNPESPINEGTLCPKGAASYQLAVNSNRWTKAKYRAPGSDHWEDISLDDAMDRIARKFKETRDGNFIEQVKVGDKQKTVNQVLAVASLGGATIDDEWNYLHQKLFRAMGDVSIENQARI